MSLTRDFRETIKARADAEPEFRAALLREVVETFLGGEVDVAKSLLRDFINATVGFQALAEETGIPAKSLMRMVGASGNPRADNLFAVLGALQRGTGVQIEIRAAA